MSTVATGPGEHITVVVEREGDSKFEIKTTDLERVSSQLRKQRHFSLFSLCITIATVIVTSLVGQVAQYISWHNNRDDGPGQRSDNPSRRSLSKGGRDCNEKTLRHTDLPRRPERPRRLANRRRPFAGFQTRAEQDEIQKFLRRTQAMERVLRSIDRRNRLFARSAGWDQTDRAPQRYQREASL